MRRTRAHASRLCFDGSAPALLAGRAGGPPTICRVAAAVAMVGFASSAGGAWTVQD
ncbi:hypothetical protein [Sphingosinicella sp. CPCC 101087]|uniref:hypothetical protein n=1 Tax=Sphingosinicella sp. CPCC 101087 TaxID=2497754 RepID=UPI0013E9D7AA|nr:hypothetical protein [Sphingosinicella sp. CPCC 101087]